MPRKPTGTSSIFTKTAPKKKPPSSSGPAAIFAKSPSSQQVSREVDALLSLGVRRPDPLTVVMQAVHAAPPRERFGAKVFVYPLWERTRARTGMDLGEFKRWLLTQARTGGLTLVRIDLTGAVDRTVLKESEILDRGAIFHAVLDPAGDGY